jgi:histidine ammonia-lyase
MSGRVLLRPGRMRLAEWRAIYRGAAIALDWVSRADVEAGAAALHRILDDPDGAPLRPRPAPDADAAFAALPETATRLALALKLGSLGQGTSGLRWGAIERLARFVAEPELPDLPDGKPNALVGLARLLADAPGGSGGVLPLQQALEEALALGPYEEVALRTGPAAQAALTLAGLFEAEWLFQSALVAFALPADGGAPLPHPQALRLGRQRGTADVAAALRALGGETERAVFPLAEMGAILDLLRLAARLLEPIANGVGEELLVLWQSGEMVPGPDHGPALRLAEDMIALALREIGVLAHLRIGRLRGPEKPKRKAGRSPAAMAKGFAAENRTRAEPLGVAPPASGPAEASPRLLAMAGTATLIVALQLVAARNEREPGTEAPTGPLAEALALLQQRLPAGRPGRVAASEFAAAAELVRSGALASAVGVALPAAVPEAEPALPRRRRRAV